MLKSAECWLGVNKKLFYEFTILSFIFIKIMTHEFV